VRKGEKRETPLNEKDDKLKDEKDEDAEKDFFNVKGFFVFQDFISFGLQFWTELFLCLWLNI
jgi:hypothetical protein